LGKTGRRNTKKQCELCGGESHVVRAIDEETPDRLGRPATVCRSPVCGGRWGHSSRPRRPPDRRRRLRKIPRSPGKRCLSWRRAKRPPPRHRADACADPGILQLVVLQSNLADFSAREASRQGTRHDARAARLANQLAGCDVIHGAQVPVASFYGDNRAGFEGFDGLPVACLGADCRRGQCQTHHSKGGFPPAAR